MSSRLSMVTAILFIDFVTAVVAAAGGERISPLPPDESLSIAATLLRGNEPAVQLETFPVRPRSDGLEPALLDDIAAWLASEFALPAIDDRPVIAFASARRMIGLRVQGTPLVSVDVRAGEIVALYDDATRTIYLPQGWTGATAAEISILVHEMVHHLQNAAGERLECAEAREKMAYEAQARWLASFGTDLAAEFGIDPMTLFVRTNCFR